MKMSLALILLLPTAAIAEPIYDSAHELLREAIVKGESHGMLKGEVAKVFSQQLRNEKALFADVTVTKSFNFSDCKRLAVKLTKKNQLTTTGDRKDFVVTIGMNYCPDGRVPYEIAGK